MFQRKCKIKPKKSPIRGIIGYGNINEEKIITLNEKEIIRCLNTGEVYDAETDERLTLKNYKNITKSDTNIKPVEKVVIKKENKSVSFPVNIKEEPKNATTEPKIHNMDKVETTIIAEETEDSNIEEVNTSIETQEEVINQNNNQPRYNNKKARNKQRSNNYKKQNQ